MSAYQVDLNTLSDGDIALVDGRVTYSHVATAMAGEELERYNKQRAERNMSPITAPQYSCITVAIASVRPNVDPATGQAQPFTKMQQAISERRYTSQVHPEFKEQFTGGNRSRFLPQVYKLREGSMTEYDPITLEGELAQNTPVTLVMRAFTPKSGRSGVTLDAVLINDPKFGYRSAGGNNLMASLAQSGLILSAPAQMVPAEPAAAAPAAETAAPVAAQPATAQPAVATQPVQPVQTAQPAAEPQTAVPFPDVAYQPVNAYAQPAAAQPTAQPAQAQPTPGLIYDPNQA